MDSATLSIELDAASGRKVVNARYTLLHTLGQGQFGKVLLAQDRVRSRHVAIKTIRRVDTARLLTKAYQSHSTKIRREVRIMRSCRHPNVVELYSVIDDARFDKILLVLEYCRLGELDWRRYNHYHEKYARHAGPRLVLNHVLRDVADGLQYLHHKHIVHRDLKPSNLLVSADRRVKISDFGVSLVLEHNANDDRELGRTMGTPAFFAPELCQFVNNRLSSFDDAALRRSRVDARIDVWSLGVVLYCLFFHALPFDGGNEFELFKNIVQGDLAYPPTRQSSRASPADLAEVRHLKDLIARLLAKNPDRRPSLAAVKAHPFTTFDLSRADALRYSESTNMPPQENSFSQKLRKLFISRTDRDPDPLPYADLEHVDDLLDSYLDDSSSFGSVEEVDLEHELESEAREEETREREEKEARESEEKEAREIEEREARKSEEKEAREVEEREAREVEEREARETKERATQRTSEESGQGGTGQGAGRKRVPPPLTLSHSPGPSLAPGQISPMHVLPAPKPAVVTIGPDSPSSAKSVSSPSRRFFRRFKKKEPAVKLTELSSQTSGYADLAPPPGFGGHASSRSSFSSVDSGFPGFPSSRKGSMSSGVSGGLSKMSSSSSSLNLHAYLVDSPSAKNASTFESNGKGEIARNDSDSTDEEADRTMTMDEFLDHLDEP